MSGGNLPIGPGFGGFLAFFALAVALYFLVRNMNSRLRRMSYRERDRVEHEAAGTPESTDTDADTDADTDVDTADENPSA